jgi:hypothetical protein
MKMRAGPKATLGLTDKNAFAPVPDPGKALRDKSAQSRSTVRVKIKLITPLYGGSAHTRKPDLLMPFRPRSIRNGVAHWWWLINRHQQKFRTNPERLWEEFALTFGARAGASNGGPSRFVVRATQPEPGTVNCAYWWPYKWQRSEKGEKLALDRERSPRVAYAMFPARGSLRELAVPGKVRKLVDDWAIRQQPPEVPDGWKVSPLGLKDPLLNEFDDAWLEAFKENDAPALMILPGRKELPLTCSISFAWSNPAMPSPEDEQRFCRLRKAILAWLSFGGLGGRTSRGMGAFEAEASLPQGKQIDPRWVQPGHTLGRASSAARLFTDDDDRQLDEFVLLMSKEGGNPLAQLQGALGEYRSLRQCRVPMAGVRTRPGLSFLPDADAMRVAQSTHSDGHAPRHPAVTGALPGWAGGKVFSDLALGAPVEMEFAKNPKVGGTEPEKVRIEMQIDGKGARYPSPVRFRPARVGQPDDPRYRCVALFLPFSRDLDDVPLTIQKGTSSIATVPAGEWRGLDAAGKFAAAPAFEVSKLEAAYGHSMPVEMQRFCSAVAETANPQINTGPTGFGPPVLMRYLKTDRSRPGVAAEPWEVIFPKP